MKNDASHLICQEISLEERRYVRATVSCVVSYSFGFSGVWVWCIVGWWSEGPWNTWWECRGTTHFSLASVESVVQKPISSQESEQRSAISQLPNWYRLRYAAMTLMNWDEACFALTFLAFPGVGEMPRCLLASRRARSPFYTETRFRDMTPSYDTF